MARILEAFHANPALGGFGSESAGISHGGRSSLEEGDCDAFAQIVKELVDNAVDACRTNTSTNTNTSTTGNRSSQPPAAIKRVQVRFTEVSPTVLRVTVTDNGCGMTSIPDCVEAFQTNKRGAPGGIAGRTIAGAGTATTTAGRYGLGLTLCLLHAQRLVPNSTASITSATKEKVCFEQRDYVVDIGSTPAAAAATSAATAMEDAVAAGGGGDDCVKCVRSVETPKDFPEECGTSVSLLVPGGPMALRAWPRLSEYFARFQLSLGLPCSFEVMAPTLCSRPLFVRSSLERQQLKKKQARTWRNQSKKFDNGADDDDEDDEDDNWNPDMAEAPSDSDCSIETDQDIRTQIQRAVSGHVARNIDIRNVAHSMQPIRNGRRQTRNSPMLEVDMIVYKKNSDEEEAEETDEGETPSAQMTLVRMVNRIPLLDGAEAAACGLVQGVASKKSMWSSFGLSIQHGTDRTAQDLRFFNPTYAIRDSDSVSSFFQSRNPLYEMREEEYDNEKDPATDDFSDDGLMDHGNGERPPRKTRKRKEFLLPAHLRLGNILLIVQIHATPSSLPLPTLSKSRLPLNTPAIDAALETGVMECLQSLQRTNPTLLLTAKQLKTTVRDTRYIPAAAAAMARVMCHTKDKNFQKHFIKVIHGWSKQQQLVDAINATDDAVHENGSKSHRDEDEGDDLSELGDEDLDASKVGPWVEAKLRRICTISDAPKPRKRKPSTRNKENRAPPPPSSPPSRQSSGSCWGGMSPSPVKKAATKSMAPADKRRRATPDSIESPEATDSVDLLENAMRKEPKDSTNASDGPRILGRDEDDYDDDEWW